MLLLLIRGPLVTPADLDWCYCCVDLFGFMRPGDPRYIRNRRGMMAYHVALTNGNPHLSELLHPDIPYAYIFSNDDMAVCMCRAGGGGACTGASAL